MPKQHVYLDLTHHAKGFVAECSCGWHSAPAPNAALAGAALDEHVTAAASGAEEDDSARAELEARIEAMVLLREAAAAVARARFAATAAGATDECQRLLHTAAESLAGAALQLGDDGLDVDQPTA